MLPWLLDVTLSRHHLDFMSLWQSHLHLLWAHVLSLLCRPSQQTGLRDGMEGRNGSSKMSS